MALGDLTDGLLAWGWEFPAASGPFPAHLRVPDPTSPFPTSPCSPPKQPALAPTFCCFSPPLLTPADSSPLLVWRFQFSNSWELGSCLFLDASPGWRD